MATTGPSNRAKVFDSGMVVHFRGYRTWQALSHWYDLETSGTDPKWDRLVQVAGLQPMLSLM